MHFGLLSCLSGLPDGETFIELAANISQRLGSEVSFSVLLSYGPKVLNSKFCLVIIFIPLVWGKCKFKIYSDDATEKNAGKEAGICIANHRYTNDWIIDFIAAEQYRNVSNITCPDKMVRHISVSKRSILIWDVLWGQVEPLSWVFEPQ